MEALNIPSASNLDKIARRLRSISQRLDEMEDGVEKLDRRSSDDRGSRTRRSRARPSGSSGSSRASTDLARDVAALRRGPSERGIAGRPRGRRLARDR